MPFLEFRRVLDRKSTRLNSSHTLISYAVFCLKKNTQSRAGCGTERRQKRRGNTRKTPAVSRRIPWRPGQPLGSRSLMAVLEDLLFFLNVGAPPESSPLPLPAAFPF